MPTTPAAPPHPLPQAYVLSQLGEAYVAPQEFRLSEIYADSTPSVPLIFVLSFGSDPMADLLKFAEEKQKQVGRDGEEKQKQVRGGKVQVQGQAGGKGGAERGLSSLYSFVSDVIAGLLRVAEEGQKQVRGSGEEKKQ